MFYCTSGLLLTVKLVLILVPCVLKLIVCLLCPFTEQSISLLLSLELLSPSRSVIIHAAISLGNFVEITVCDHRKWFHYLSLRSKLN